MPTGSPNPIDKHVGARVRIRRIEIDMSQADLGAAVGVTYQQIQKYEMGASRIGASRLQRIGKALRVPTATFFDGAPGGFNGTTTPDVFMKFLGTEDGQRLAVAFNRISHLGLRRRVVRLIETIGKPPRKQTRPKSK
jgi:transcriptional regulator with XRE-family HTH domain